MAVPRRRSGLNEDDDEEEGQQNYALLEEGLADIDSDTPPHLRELSAAVHGGDFEALRVALGLFTPTWRFNSMVDLSRNYLFDLVWRLSINIYLSFLENEVRINI